MSSLEKTNSSRLTSRIRSNSFTHWPSCYPFLSNSSLLSVSSRTASSPAAGKQTHVWNGPKMRSVFLWCFSPLSSAGLVLAIWISLSHSSAVSHGKYCVDKIPSVVNLVYTRSVPLCYVYPAMLHYKACSRSRKDKLADIAMITFGLIAAAYTTTQTIWVCCSCSIEDILADVHYL